MSATLAVTTAVDEFDGGTAANAAGPDGQLSLREAISAASSGDQITFAPTLSGSTITLDPNKGELLLNKDLDILGPGAASLAISGQVRSRVFEVAIDATDTITGLTIESGFGATPPNGPIMTGAGISNNGNLTVTGCTLSNNRVSDYLRYASYGGGIYNGSGTLTVTDSTFSGNVAFWGGGIYNGGGNVTVSNTTLSGNSGGGGAGIFNNGGTVTVSGGTLAGNHGIAIQNLDGALTVSGGTLLSGNQGNAIYNEYGAVTVSNALLLGNIAFKGGGIFNLYGTASVSGCTFTGTDNYDGGGIVNYFGGTLTVSDSSFSGFSVVGIGTSGTGILNIETATVSRCTFSGNSIGIDNRSRMTVGDCTISGNSGYSGAGISNFGDLTVSDTVITGNTAVYAGGGIYNGGTLTLIRSTVCENSAPIGPDLYNLGRFTLTDSCVCDIALAGTTTTLTSSLDQSVLGQPVILTATVASVGSATPTGAVTFLLEGGTILGTGTLNGSGRASITVAGLAVGSHTVTAVYSGDGNTATSTSASLTQTVLSAQQELSLVINRVTTLVTSGVLGSQFGNALVIKLNNAIVSLNSGNSSAGVNQLDAFINQANAFLKSGKLNSADAMTLIYDIGLAIVAVFASPI